MNELGVEPTVERAVLALKGSRRLVMMLAAGELIVFGVCGLVVWLTGGTVKNPEGKPDTLFAILGLAIPWAAYLGSWLMGARWREVRAKTVVTPAELMDVLGRSAGNALFVAEGGTILSIVFFLLTGQWWLVPVAFLPGFLLTISMGPRAETFAAVTR